MRWDIGNPALTSLQDSGKSYMQQQNCRGRCHVVYSCARRSHSVALRADDWHAWDTRQHEAPLVCVRMLEFQTQLCVECSGAD
jgi:hypothetical protein